MIVPIKKLIKDLNYKLAPKLELLKVKWRQLQPREQQLLMVMVVAIVGSLIFMFVTGLVSYKANLADQVNGLSKFTIYSRQTATAYKSVNGVQANTFNQVNLQQIKGDVGQVLQIKNPDISIQNNQMTVNISSLPFEQVMTLLEQFRRSYALFPIQVNIIRLAKPGYVSFNATFGVTG